MHKTPMVMARPKLAKSAYARRQIFQRRQRHGLGIDRAQLAACQLDIERDVTAAVEAIDLCRAAVDADVRHVRDQDRPEAPGHRETLDGREVGTHGIRQLHAHRHLALAEVELGQAHVVITRCGHAHGFGNALRGDAKICCAREIRAHDDLGAHEAGAGRDIADALECAQIALDRARGAGQCDWIFAAQHQLHFYAYVLRADGEPHTRHACQTFTDLGLHRLLGTAAITAIGQQHGHHRLACLGCCADGKRITGCTAPH